MRDVVKERLETGRVRHPFFGIRPAPLTPEIARQFNLKKDRGVLVPEVTAGSPAAAAGLRPGDVLLRAGDRQLETVEDSSACCEPEIPGESLEVVLFRTGDEHTVTVRLGERP